MAPLPLSVKVRPLLVRILLLTDRITMTSPNRLESINANFQFSFEGAHDKRHSSGNQHADKALIPEPVIQYASVSTAGMAPRLK